MNTDTPVFVLTDAVKAEIDRWVKKYPEGKQQSAVVEALFLAQDQNGGWLSDAALKAVADYLKIPVVAACEAASFYDMFHLQPVGKHKISICTNVPCALRGAGQLVDAVQSRLGVGLNQTTDDGLFTIKEVECMAACIGAPMCQVNDRAYHENLTPESLVALIDTLAAQEGNNNED